ncbi:MAG: UDP-N-acetylmuramate dehydrogenase [Clostridia bacterium]|nr:UDP-N-acetylmuramate dehydrogenase [Clostridia bacterium]
MENHIIGYREFEAALEAAGIEYRKNELLSGYATFRIGGPADIAVFPKNEAELEESCSAAGLYGVRFIAVGNGSDLLFDDAGFRGAVIFTSSVRSVAIEGNMLTVGCGMPLTVAAKLAADAGLSGLEFSFGIPGSVGGAVFMNAGAYGGQISDVLSSCRMLNTATGEIITVPGSEMRFGYRRSLPAEVGGLIVLSASFELKTGDSAEITGKMRELMGRRISKQPLDMPSAGSVFRRPAPDIFVGKMIEDSGLKGSRVGGAEVSNKHAGFIVNAGGAKAEDVKKLVGIIKDRIYSDYGVRLETEIEYVPEKDDGVTGR